MIVVNRIENAVSSIVWYVNYVYILIVAIYELTFFRERLIKRNLMRPSYAESLTNVELLKHRDPMDNEWELYRSIMPYIFLLMPVSYLLADNFLRGLKDFSDKVTETIHRQTMVMISLLTCGYLMSPAGLLILLFITFYFWSLSKFNSKALIWISAFGLTTVSNWNANLFMQFLSDDLSRYQKYFVEFMVVTQMFRIVSFSLTLVDQAEKDSFFDAVEYNTYIPILCGPWCIYPIFRQDRLKPRERWSIIELGTKIASILSIFVFIEFYLHVFPFQSVSADRHTQKGLSLTALAGVHLGAVQHFSNKYMVMYGLPATFSTSIGRFCPGGPHNVSTRSTFRDMWQLFDKGLHLFLKNFVYLPIVSSTGSALLGSILSFFTVFYWHGANETCAYWALNNWLGVSVERQLYLYSKHTELTWPKSRLILLGQAVLFGLLINSNVIYLFEWEVTLRLVQRLYLENLYFTLYAHLVLYCGVITINTNHISKIKVE